MNQKERLKYLITYLLNENGRSLSLPESISEQKKLLRGLMNIRPPAHVSMEFLKIQDEYLLAERGKVISLQELEPITDNLYLWNGDITTLEVDAIVNAANSALLGCFIPCHNCIDNVIHSSAGVQLRLECAQLMQGKEEITGNARLTKAWNLPSKYIIHTVGPIVEGNLTPGDCLQLESCYKSCLNLAVKNILDSIAFCCISTGVFHFPQEDAAKIAVNMVRNFLRDTNYNLKVVFDVFKDEDFSIYTRLLSGIENCQR